MAKGTSSVLLIVFLVSLPASPIFAQFLQKTTETTGMHIQWNRFSSDFESQSYVAFVLPFRATFQQNRYRSFSLTLNQGFQSFEEEGVYGISDLRVSLKQLLSRNIGPLKAEEWTFVADLTIPVGTKELEREQLTATSAGRLPYVHTPLSYGASGLGFKVGSAYGHQLTEDVVIGLGLSYDFRRKYKPIQGGSEYDPSDEILLAVGLEYGDRDFGCIGDVQLGFYTSEKVDGREGLSPGMGLSVSGRVFREETELSVMYTTRGKDEQGVIAFQVPSVLTVKLAQGFAFADPIVPYLGLERNNEGTRVPAATVLLLGGHIRSRLWGGYPVDPYVEVKYGNIGNESNTLGFKFGTTVALRVY